jgi:hypothetical protein
MSLNRTIVGVAAAALIATLPAIAGAQERQRTACNDGSTSASMASNACDGHGGIHKSRTAILRRSPATASKPAPVERVAQAGTPTPARTAAPDPRYEERRGWRWRRHHDEQKHTDKDERRYRCRDGRWETVHGKAKGKEICKHHGGIAN